MVGFPLVLQSNITGFSSSPVRAPDDPLALQCPGKGAMLVEAISFAFDRFAPHEVFIQNGRAKLTNGYVPITGILAPQEARLWRSQNGTSIGNCAATWRFDMPMYVPPGSRVSIMWKAYGGVSTLLTKVEVALKCRHLPADYPEPRAVAVPWATMFRPAGTAPSADTTSFYKSVIGDITNHFRTSLNVRHLIADGTGGGEGWDGPAAVFSNDDDSNTTGFGPLQNGTQRFVAQVQLRDWLGNNIVRDPTPLYHLCNPVRREWRTDFVLPPTRSLFVTMDERHAQLGGAGASLLQPSIALVGWRNEAIEEVK